MRCANHRRDYMGVCSWCGKQLCGRCVVHQDGKKAYCVKCSPTIAQLGHVSLPMRSRPLPYSGKRFIFKNGQLISRQENGC